jgi:hypothetical protein
MEKWKGETYREYNTTKFHILSLYSNCELEYRIIKPGDVCISVRI